MGAAWSLAMSPGLRTGGPQGGLEQVTLPCLSFLVCKTKRRDWDDLRRAFHIQSFVCIFLGLGFYLVLLKFPLIKIQLTTSARKSRVKVWHS